MKYSKRKLLSLAATATIGVGLAVVAAAPAQADAWGDSCVYVCLMENVNFGGNMTFTDPNKATLRGDWWNDQASSVATKVYPTRFWQNENYTGYPGCTFAVPARASANDLRNKPCSDPNPQIAMNDEISSWRIGG